jgi:alkylation response protein AidB-like acyl-CoA dehydrogenase
VLPTLDLTRKFARITLRGAVATAVGTPGSARTLLADTLDVARIYLAAEQLGGATRCLDQAVDYAKSRVQFGRQIGSFQAVKHRCANMLCAVEDARSAVRYASWVADHRPADLGRAAALAKAVSSDAFMFAAASNIQVHGGIGFTWEHTVHLPFKRAKAMQVFLGDSHAQRRRLADYLGL